MILTWDKFIRDTTPRYLYNYILFYSIIQSY